MAKIVGDDRLSTLPDDILVNILDRLNIRDAARTSVLSRRWQHLPDMLSQLKIDVFDFRHEDNPTVCLDEIVRINAAVVEATKSILARRDSSRNTIQSLCMDFFLKEDDPISIGNAVGRTMLTHKVDIAEFTVMTERDDTDCDDDDLISYGRQFMVFFDACPIAFGGLTHLRLGNLRFGELDISNVLITCEKLEYLRLFNCDSGSWTVLQVQHSQLVELAIVDCSFERVELNLLPKLQRMTFDGWISFEDPLSLGYLPLLEALSLGNVCLSGNKMIKLSKFLVGTSLRDLTLGFECEKIWVQPELCLTKRQASVFNKLRFVHLDKIPEGHDLTWTLFILEIAPNLKELYLTVWDHLCQMETDEEERKALLYSENKGLEWEPSTSSFQHRSLATLVIFGFESSDYMVKYVRRVMETAVNLKDVFLYDKPVCRECQNVRRVLICFPFLESLQRWVHKSITKGINSSALVHFPTGSIRDNHYAKRSFP